MGAKIEFFFDCLSPFSYFAFQVLRRYKQRWGISLVLRPSLLGGIMAATKNIPPGARPWAAATAKEGAQHLARNKQWFNTPEMLGVPSNFFGPQGPADPTGLSRDFRYMRLLTVIALKHPDVLDEVVGSVFAMIWADKDARDANGHVIMNEETLTARCTRAGLTVQQAKECVAQINSDVTKDALKQAVKDCVGAGGYGMPFFRITEHGQSDQPEEMIAFGSDRFEQIAFAMKKPWFGPDPDAPWQAKL